MGGKNNSWQKAGGKKPFNERFGGVTKEINNDIMPPGKMKGGEHTNKK